MNLLIIDRPGWHVNDLKRAADSNLQITVAGYNELAASFTTSGDKRTGFRIANQPIQSFDAILIRAMPASSLEQIVFRMDALNQIEKQFNIPIINPAKTIESCVDKYLSLELLRDCEIPVPETSVAQTTEQALIFFEAMGKKSVVKPIFGSQGRGIELITSLDSAKQLFQRLESSGNVIYQQRFVDHGDTDLRVLVVGSETFAVKRQRPGHWITNASQGAACHRHESSLQETAISLGAANSQGAFLAGVDIVYENGHPFVVEVNACPSWRHLSAALSTDVSAAVLYMISKLASQ